MKSLLGTIPLSQKKLSPTITAYYRAGTSDERVLEEVLGGIYRRKKLLFDVEKGEHWLDLGANIGSFALYCRLHKATAACYEPDPECFKILLKNAPDFPCYPMAVTNQLPAFIPFWKGRLPTDNYRGTAIPSNSL